MLAGAVEGASAKIKAKARKAAAHLMEVDPDDLEWVDGGFQIRGVPGQRKGLDEIAAGLPDIEGWEAPPGAAYPGPVLALAGDQSDYVRPEHRAAFRALFPAVRFATLRDAGHWMHADQPEAFTATAAGFLKG